jgi:hypothetical protein
MRMVYAMRLLITYFLELTNEIPTFVNAFSTVED